MGTKILDWPAYIHSRTTVDPKTGCWNWTGPLLKPRKEYGYCGFAGKTVFLAHRMSYIVFNGEIPSGLHVMHQCHNTKCLNPAHLQLGTVLENNGQRHAVGGYTVKFTKEQRALTRGLHTQFTMAELAKQFNTSTATIHSIVHAKHKGDS